MGAGGRQTAGQQLVGEGAGQPVQDEPQRRELVRCRLDGESQGEPLGRTARPERLELLAAGPGVDPRALLPEAGDERRAVELGDRAHLAQAEAGEAGPDIGVLGQQAGRERGEERGLAAGRDEGRGPRLGAGGGDGRDEAGAGDRGTDRGTGTDRGGGTDRPRRRGPRPRSPAGRARAGPVPGRRPAARRGPVRDPTTARGRRRGPRTARTSGPPGRSCRPGPGCTPRAPRTRPRPRPGPRQGRGRRSSPPGPADVRSPAGCPAGRRVRGRRGSRR